MCGWFCLSLYIVYDVVFCCIMGRQLCKEYNNNRRKREYDLLVQQPPPIIEMIIETPVIADMY